MNFTPEPTITLIERPQHSGYNLSVGAARTCYAPNAVPPERADKVYDKEQKKYVDAPELADRIFSSVIEAGHRSEERRVGKECRL